MADPAKKVRENSLGAFGVLDFRLRQSEVAVSPEGEKTEEGALNRFQRGSLGIRFSRLLAESSSRRIGLLGTGSLAIGYGLYDYRVLRPDGTDYPDQSLLWSLAATAGLGPSLRFGSWELIAPVELKLTTPFGEFNNSAASEHPADHGIGIGADFGGQLSVLLQPPLNSSCSIKGSVGTVAGFSRPIAGPYLTQRRYPEQDIALSPQVGTTGQVGVVFGFSVGPKGCKSQQTEAEKGSPPSTTKPPPPHTQEVPPKDQPAFQWDISDLRRMKAEFDTAYDALNRFCANPHDPIQAREMIARLVRLKDQILSRINQIDQAYVHIGGLAGLKREYSDQVMSIYWDVIGKAADLHKICTESGETPPELDLSIFQARLEEVRRHLEEMKFVCAKPITDLDKARFDAYVTGANGLVTDLKSYLTRTLIAQDQERVQAILAGAQQLLGEMQSVLGTCKVTDASPQSPGVSPPPKPPPPPPPSHKPKLRPFPPPKPPPPEPPPPKPPAPPPAAEPPKVPPAPGPATPIPPRKDGCPEVTDKLHKLLTSGRAASIGRPGAQEINAALEELGLRREIRERVFSHLKETVRDQIKEKRGDLEAKGILPSQFITPPNPNAQENRALGLQVFKLWLRAQQEELAKSNGRGLPGAEGFMIKERFTGLKVSPSDVGILFRDPVLMRGGPGALFGQLSAMLSYCATANDPQENAAAERMYNSLLGQYASYDKAEEELNQDLKGEALDEAFYELLPFVGGIKGEVLAHAIRLAFEECGDVPPEGYELVAQVLSEDLKKFQKEKGNKHFYFTGGLYLFAYAFPPAGAVGKGALWLLQTAMIGADRRQAIATLQKARTYNELGLLSDQAAKDLEAEAAVSLLTRHFPGGNFGLGSLIRAGATQALLTDVAYHLADHPEADQAMVLLEGAGRGIMTALAGQVLGILGRALRPGDAMNVVGVLVPRNNGKGGVVVEVRGRDGSVRDTHTIFGTVKQSQDGRSLTVTPEGGGAPLQVPVPRGGARVAAIPRGCNPATPSSPATGGGRSAAGAPAVPTGGRPAGASASTPGGAQAPRGGATPAPAGRSGQGAPRGATGVPPAPASATAGPKRFKVFGVGTYADLKRGYRQAGGASKMGETHMDHLPSQAARVRAEESNLGQGRRLTARKRREIEDRVQNEGVAIAIPARLHRLTSRTYGGRNNPLQIARDAGNLGAAFERDAQALLAGARRLRFSPTQMQNLENAINEARILNRLKGVF